jgi:ABC-type multidrug transport system fused ATPase/permease subunit
MRHHSSSSLPLPGPARGGDWRVIGRLLPYVWAYRRRVVVAMTALVAAKLANVGVPILMKTIVDSLDARTATLSVPLALLAAYGLLRLSTTAFTEIREYLFA